MSKSFVALSIILVSSAYSEIIPVEADHPHRLYIEPNVFLFDLKTNVQGMHIMGLKCFGGLKLGYEYLKPQIFYIGVDILSTWSNHGFQAETSRIIFSHNSGLSGFGSLDMRLGYPFKAKNILVSPFIGIGSYAFGSRNHFFHFTEDAFYYAGGIRFSYDWTPALRFGANLKALFTSDTSQSFKFLPGNTIIKLTQSENAWGGEVGIPITWHMGVSKRWDLQLEPYMLRLGGTGLQNIYGTSFLFGYHF